VVPGTGSETAEIMFIGEGPGANEDKQGIPFCGAAGKFLDELLEGIELKRDDVFVTNMVKCRPPGNRDPQSDEIAACKTWTNALIELIKPKVFVLLGRFAMGKFFPTFKISQVHGKAYRKWDKVFVVMYHPAVALYNGSFREVLRDDFKILRSILDGDESEIEDLAPPVNEIKKKMEEKRASKGKEKIQMGMGL
jgi:DNA polymerase